MRFDNRHGTVTRDSDGIANPTSSIHLTGVLMIASFNRFMERLVDSIKEAIFKQVDGAGGEVAEDTFVLKIQRRPKYKFSDAYETKNQELKDLKKAEIENGTATIDGHSEFVTIKFKND